MSNENPNVNPQHTQPMSEEEHRERHIILHNHLDELFADYIDQHPDQHGFINMPLIWLINWSKQQTENPTVKTR